MSAKRAPAPCATMVVKATMQPITAAKILLEGEIPMELLPLFASQIGPHPS